ncbi:MAG: AmmeMemoRadiSam system protein A [Bacillota bacterium]
MGLVASYILPHPPVVIDKIGKNSIEDCKKTYNSLKKVAKEIKRISPDTVIVISPHGPIFSDAVTINSFENLKGDFKKFGHSSLKIQKQNDLDLMEEIYSEATIDNIPIAKIDQKFINKFDVNKTLDHGVMVPIYYLEKIYSDFNLIPINYGLLSSDKLYEFGMSIKKACNISDRKVVLIASGDLSHKLSNQGPYSFSKKGVEFDDKITQYLKENKIKEIIGMDNKLCKEAGECGKRSIDIMLGALDGLDYEMNFLSYEKPFGVGYSVVSYTNLKKGGKKLYKDILKQKNKKNKERINKEDIYVKLARKTINKWVKEKEKLSIDELDLPKEMLNKRAGVFVSIKNSSGLRGCIGTTGKGMEKNIALEIRRNAIQACSNDPRFPEVKPFELDDLKINVDILKESKPVDDLNELDPEKYGIIVSFKHKKGLLLPRLDGIDTVDKQLDIALKKAGINKNSDYDVEKFEVIRH